MDRNKKLTSQSPNLLFVFPDQMRGSAMGFLGEEPVITPVLDRFSEQALVLPNAISNYPICSPYRGMLMTGMYPHANKVTSNCTDETEPYGVELQMSDRCWSDILKDHSYSLGYIGKWHLESPRAPFVDCLNNNLVDDVRWNEWTPPQRRHGFDYWYAYNTYDYHLRPLYWSTDAARDAFHFVDQWGPEHEADQAIAYLHNEEGRLRDPDQPFALVVGMNPPHMPYEAVPDQYVERYSRLKLDDLAGRLNIPPAGTQWGDYYRKHIRNYFAMISGVDEQFGRILQALEDQKLAENTIVVFTSDHGNCLGIHDRISKGNAYEESLRVPFLVRWPGHIPGRRDDLLFSAPDLYPTLIDLMGFGADIPAQVEGSSYAPIFRGEDMPRPSSSPYYQIPFNQPGLGERGVRTQRYTFIHTRNPGLPEEKILFDNQTDPFQLHNRAAEEPERVQTLEMDLQRWLEKTKDPWLEGI